jgi:Zn-dependent protease with chaperone function
VPLQPVPLLYHRAIVGHLRAQEAALWSWFASTRKRLEEADAVRLDLLKSTYRLEPQAQPKLYDLANAVRERVGLSCSVTLYQAQTGQALNAALAFLPGEAHVILAGPLASVLSENELRAVLAHELAHYLLYEDDGGAYLVASDLLRSLSADAATGLTASESARLYSLWTEIYADRWAFHVSGDVTASIAALIKIETGLTEVSAESYLRQADEIFARGHVQTDNISHPETFIRARALRLWAEQGDAAHPEIERMIEGGLNVHRLDLLGQARAADLTRRFLQMLLKPKWFQTEPLLGHAKRFFADFTVDDDVASGAAPSPPAPLPLSTGGEGSNGDGSLRDYLCYLLLDFTTVDRELGDVALSAAIVLARRLGIDKRFAELAQKELALGKKAFAKIDKDAEAILARTEAAHAS